MIFKVKVDSSTIITDENGKLKLKLSSDANNGLSFDASGNLIANPGSSSGTGIYNTPGNAILGVVNQTTHKADPIITVGMNSTVSRHKKYTGVDNVIIENDGPVIVKMSGTTISSDCLVDFILHPRNGGGT